MEDYYIDT